jgi:hypothetical protein
VIFNTITATTISASTYCGMPDRFGVSCDGQGGVLSTGVTNYITMGTSGHITGWDIVSPITGNVTFDIWKVSGGVLPTVANTIVTDSTFPLLTGALFSSSTAVSGWVTSFSAGDIFAVNINSATGLTKANLTIRTIIT